MLGEVSSRDVTGCTYVVEQFSVTLLFEHTVYTYSNSPHRDTITYTPPRRPPYLHRTKRNKPVAIAKFCWLQTRWGLYPTWISVPTSFSRRQQPNGSLVSLCNESKHNIAQKDGRDRAALELTTRVLDDAIQAARVTFCINDAIMLMMVKREQIARNV